MEAAKKIILKDGNFVRELVGSQSENIKHIENRLGVKISVRVEQFKITGNSEVVEIAKIVIEKLSNLISSGYEITISEVNSAINMLLYDKKLDLKKAFPKDLSIHTPRMVVTPKGLGQVKYVEAIIQSDVVFGIGPAGTGKTYLAMALAVSYLMNKEVKRIVLTRPALEAGEKLGFLPGDILDKINPYLRPLYDALYDFIEFEKASRMIQRGIIEVAPLAFMRGRTLNDAFVILDEAQNTTSNQMKMFLTRLGYRSKVVVTGDITQVDLPESSASGLMEVQRILKGVKGISFIYLDKNDVVRHPLVQEIIDAYEKFEKESE